MKLILLGIILFATFLAFSAEQPLDKHAANETLNFASQQTIAAPSNRDSKTDPRPWWLNDLLTLIGIVVTLSGIVIGAKMIVYQLARQHESALALQKESLREKLRLEIHREFLPLLDEAGDKSSSARIYAFTIPVNFRNYLDQFHKGFNPRPIKDRSPEFSKRHFESINSIIKLVRLIEKHDVVSKDLEIFKYALHVANHDLTKFFHPLHSYLVHLLPMDVNEPNSNVQVINVVHPTESDLQQLDVLVGAYINAQEDLDGFLYDLNVELQNIFLGKLFGNKVPRRQPIDPRVKVVSTEPEEMKKLRHYFEKETDWGRNKSRIEQEVSAKFTDS